MPLGMGYCRCRGRKVHIGDYPTADWKVSPRRNFVVEEMIRRLKVRDLFCVRLASAPASAVGAVGTVGVTDCKSAQHLLKSCIETVNISDAISLGKM